MLKAKAATARKGAKAAGKGVKKEAEGAITGDLVRALGHPCRVQALNLLNEKVASPTELALAMNQTVNFVAYHVRQLEKFDCIELVDTKQRRGAVEHFYRATRRAELEDEEWLEIPVNLREDIDLVSITVMTSDLRESLVSGKFEGRDSRHWSHTPGVVDHQGWEEVRDLLRETQERYMAVLGQCKARLAESGEESIPLAVTLQSFELST